MLGVLCVARPKPWILSSFSLSNHGSAVHHCNRLHQIPPILFSSPEPRRHHTSACCLGCGGGAASIWHAILPSGGKRRRRDLRRPAELKGEGSWNVAWDARPARWLHWSDSAWLLFGVCACLAPVLDFGSAFIAAADANTDEAPPVVVADDRSDGRDGLSGPTSDYQNEGYADFKVTGVLADGRCLFRAIAHGACLKSGEEAPDENRQRDFADELRAKVVDELLKRREETEWFIEGDFDAYVKRIQQPYVWGGEPELLMASHVLKTMISVYMVDRSSGNLVNIANYGEEYRKEKESPINVLFHGYGHYDLLETLSDPITRK
ncbi:OTU domain-containing protein [Cephalotus follicularis]|uniref:Ubiquitin thioesterase OTU n=1 Tax=Cephalotus follicularis TaxID=3775 RepID=A0A1Q3ARV6_CEPFO|nr:OTU domain-containing protein [Cephalotus follicularis]